MYSNKIITILKGEGISLRLVDWFVTNYCKKYYVMYNLLDFRPAVPGMTDAQRRSFDNFIIVHTNYKGQLKAYSKRNFDPFCRRNRIRFYYEENKYFITTVGQLNFFKWAILNKVIDYIVDNYETITNDMTTRLTMKNKHTKTEDSISTISTISTDESAHSSSCKTNNTKTRKKREELSVSACLSIRKEFVPVKITF